MRMIQREVKASSQKLKTFSRMERGHNNNNKKRYLKVKYTIVKERHHYLGEHIEKEGEDKKDCSQLQTCRAGSFFYETISVFDVWLRGI